jgi:hypothetical protein
VRRLAFDETAILVAVATRDPDPRVRWLAAGRLTDPRLLAEIAERDPDAGIRRAAAERALSIVVSAAGNAREGIASIEQRLLGPPRRREVVRRAALDGVSRRGAKGPALQKLVAAVAHHAEDEGTRKRAIEALADHEELRRSAIRDKARAVALAAVEKLEQTGDLEAVIAWSELTVARERARTRLAARRGSAIIPAPCPGASR